ncbi:TPA: hypothetical protein RJJ83_002247 [Staphylococcus pseudintermedius]|uniref:hypothetical protein n=1 Tax=Staphylococcus pseudintermedius TaxID=283734 RepID=UPI00080634F3|nr:hypothetical protein [Staphylococcus pseudintermedius]ANQ81943.1 hypothetical protein A9I66_07865 [Staphylococcus pseudintermedius]EGQ1687356.1 hypothetical protein [Staphylococcus pseudintermedius]EGQ2747326.1 hypothetical protein [Staphylococcus pseudintermedius]EGQ3422103.1 hypothetical protein [Staphylococcus pseudintermedius]EGQ3898964.1 hypothetical protein [Staphylococcus pseudintermedius]
MKLLKYTKIALLIIFLAEEIRNTRKYTMISKIELASLKNFKKEYRNLINELHFKIRELGGEE